MSAPTGYGKRLNQLSGEEMKWWHANAFHPVEGGTYLCRRGNKEQGTVAGKVYIFNGSCLLHYTTRHQTMLLNGYNTLRQAYAFEVHPKCPICAAQVFDTPEGKNVVHDVVQCAHEDATR
jgi:hypothetical protein